MIDGIADDKEMSLQEPKLSTVKNSSLLLMVKQVKGDLQQMRMAGRSYYHRATGTLVSTFSTTGATTGISRCKGEVVVGEQRINGQNLYFDQTGKPVKETAANPDGSISYYDVHTGEKLLIVGLIFRATGISMLKEKATVSN